MTNIRIKLRIIPCGLPFSFLLSSRICLTAFVLQLLDLQQTSSQDLQYNNRVFIPVFTDSKNQIFIILALLYAEGYGAPFGKKLYVLYTMFLELV